MIVCDVCKLYLFFRILGLDLEGVLNLYSELSVVQSKTKMSRHVLNQLVSQPDHELYLIAPKSLQDRIDKAVESFPRSQNARAFVRASGTEEVCRVYAEALSPECATELAKNCVSILSDFI